jgi:hypothetical protein
MAVVGLLVTEASAQSVLGDSDVTVDPGTASQADKPYLTRR